jgi:hypothetical protein
MSIAGTRQVPNDIADSLRRVSQANSVPLHEFKTGLSRYQVHTEIVWRRSPGSLSSHPKCAGAVVQVNSFHLR